MLKPLRWARGRSYARSSRREVGTGHGGTGSFGNRFVETILERHRPRRLVVFSRDELKQYEMSQRLSMERHPQLRYFIGDVRDNESLARALDDLDVVVHAAALKQVLAAEYSGTARAGARAACR